MDSREYFRQFADAEEFERIVEKPTVTAMITREGITSAGAKRKICPT